MPMLLARGHVPHDSLAGRLRMWGLGLPSLATGSRRRFWSESKSCPEQSCQIAVIWQELDRPAEGEAGQDMAFPRLGRDRKWRGQSRVAFVFVEWCFFFVSFGRSKKDAGTHPSSSRDPSPPTLTSSAGLDPLPSLNSRGAVCIGPAPCTRAPQEPFAALSSSPFLWNPGVSQSRPPDAFL